MHMKYRKYLMEGGLELFSSGANVIQPHSLYHIKRDEALRDILEGCNLYMIARRRRISIDPNSFKLVGNSLTGDFLVQDGLEHERFAFTYTPDETIVAAQAVSYPEDRVVLITNTGASLNLSMMSFMTQCQYDLDGADELEILYIGKAYGQSGERLAIDRLEAHSTFQRILADTLFSKPDHEIQILMFRFEHYKKHASGAGDFSLTPIATDDESIDHFYDVMNAEFDRENRVLLAEAGLIRYFEPEYNKMYKKTFPSDKHKILADILSKDFSGLTVQVDTQNIKTSVYSRKVNSFVPNLSVIHPHVHIAKIPLNTKDERESFLHGFL
ncbi:conserved hypothetical protein [Vibrio chagasii]|nr:conserved hypothetical protein [Vibrio owensii]CAH7326765.1 conserved hypothetical protein [Vibrio chagasii]CAH7336905.1 conserved hypothetical protein [Vibrio chagasii]CAH7368795.1 conserved hypothetical protein [Vibrio chagasii]